MTLPPSDHFNGKTFFNPGHKAHASLSDVLRWKSSSRPKPWPKSVPVNVRPAPPAPSGPGVSATWIGHSTFLIRSAAATLITDPIFSDRASPVSWAGPKRAVAPGVDFERLPKVDLVLLSHDHNDHCDMPTLRRLAARDQPVIACPLGHRPLLSSAGFSRIVEGDWWQSMVTVPGVETTLLPSRHWSRRRPYETNTRLWGGFMLRLGGRTVYFAGDSGYDGALFKEIGRRCEAPDLSLIPIGAYEPQWFMRAAHMNPEEAVSVHRDVRSRRSLAMHWGTFQLTDEARLEPVEALATALSTSGLDPGAFTAMDPGDTLVV